MATTAEELKQQVLKLGISERMFLVEEIWDSIAADKPVHTISEARKAELDRRFADIATNPNDEEPWENVKQELLGE